MPRKKKTEKRAALALPPTFGSVNDSQDAYVNGLMLRQLARQYGRYWAFHATPTTVALPGNRFAKSLKPFTAHETEEQFSELLREYSDLGCPRPSGYADVFHEKFSSPRVNWSINATLAPVFAGAWQAALSPGWHYGRFYKYDMRSAYLWAATLGLPDTRTYRRSKEPWNDKYDGVYRVRLLEPCVTAPFPFDRARECLASTQEIEVYGLKIAEVIDGVIWKRTVEPIKILEAIRLTSTWKLAGRSYWGRWAQIARVECVARGGERRWNIPNLALNIPWAHSIVSRVKMRLWEFSTDALHVYVDSVITPRRIPVGPDIGDWKLERTYDAGVMIRRPGQYGDAQESRLERMAGVPLDSPLRNTA